MSVTVSDVRHIARLARLGVTDESAERLTRDLNGILTHMSVLDGVQTAGVEASATTNAEGGPLRADLGPPIPLARPLDEFAPRVRDGLLLVPRLASHEASAE